jgi:hypothetical protein
MPDDPFSGCLIHGCTTPLYAPIDLFCEPHYLVVPREIRHDLETLLGQKEYDRDRWHALCAQATAAAIAATSCQPVDGRPALDANSTE